MASRHLAAKSRGEVRAVDDVSLDIHAGETLGLVGESGSGKSTLGRLILRLIEPTSGSVRFEGRDLLAGQSRAKCAACGATCRSSFRIRSPRSTRAFEWKISSPSRLIIHGDSGGDGRHRPSGRAKLDLQQRVAELLRAVGLDESARTRYPHEFSGGQRQRIGIARALALRPKFIVCDEPVSALDVSVGAQIVNLLAQLQRDFGLTYLFISHSMPVVRYLSTRIAVMYRGKIVEVGDTEQIAERPAHAYTRSLLEATPEFSLEVALAGAYCQSLQPIQPTPLLQFLGNVFVVTSNSTPLAIAAPKRLSPVRDLVELIVGFAGIIIRPLAAPRTSSSFSVRSRCLSPLVLVLLRRPDAQ